MPRCPICHRRLSRSTPCPIHAQLSREDEDEPGGDDLAPPSIAGYAIHARLGAGGFARVFVASRAGDGRQVALKVGRQRGDWRFEREVAALASVTPPHAPALYEAGATAEGHPYLALELIVGRSVADWLATQPNAVPARDQAMNVLRDVCAAADAIARAGIVHRDLKPENLMLHDRGVTVIDFGLARRGGHPEAARAGAEATTAGQRLGTPAYMAPEQCLGHEVGPETDTYAVGVIAYELLCGRPPFVGAATEIEQAHVATRPPAASAIGDLPEAIDLVFRRALAKPREDRFPTAGALYAELAGALEQGRITPSAKARGPEKVRERRLAVLAVRAQAAINHLREAAGLDGGELVHTSGAWYVFAFPRALSIEHGVRAAVAVGTRLEPAAEGSVVHVASLRIREARHGIVALGRALDQVAAWTPAELATSRVLLTKDAAAVFPESLAPSPSPGFYAWATASDSPENTATGVALRGRGELLGVLQAAGARCARDRAPSISTVLGDVGAGKTRVLDAVAEAAERRGVRVIRLRAQPPEARASDGVLEALVKAAFSVDRATSHDRLIRAVERALGRSDPAIAGAILGAFALAAPAEGAAMTMLAQDPGLQRRLLASAIGEALRRRAADEPHAIVLDDAHWAEPAVLDALEAAAIAEGHAPLWVVAAAQPQLRDRRPGWGSRAVHAQSHELAPLDLEAARELLLDLLRPAEYIPEPIVARVVALCEGLPLHLVQVAGLLRQEGRIRRLRGTESFYVAGDDLLRLSATPLAQRLAERAVGQLPPPLVALTQVAAVLEHEIAPADVDAVAGAAPGLGDLDPGVGLAALARRGLLRGEHGAFRFRSPLLAEAIRAAIPPGQRDALHAAAADHLGARDAPSLGELTRLANHAAACGRSTRAAAVFLRLGDLCARDFDSVAADQHYTAALGQLDQADARGRERALAGRGRARLRTRQLARAVDDLQAASALAQQRADAGAMADYLLEQATVHDWAQEFPQAAAAVARVEPLVEPLHDPALRLRWLFARGRCLYREERLAEAAELLARAVALAPELGDHETHVTALLVLASALALLGQLDEADRRFSDVIALCEAAGDLVHLGAAYGNRIMLWMARREYQRAFQDLARSNELARILGNVQLERVAAHNLAELQLWLGRHDDALLAAQRSRELEARYYPAATVIDTLLLARIRRARGDLDDARALLAEIDASFTEDQIDPTQRPLLAMVRLSCTGAPAGAWLDVLDTADQVSLLDERLEILVAAIEAALARGDRDFARRLIERGGALAEPWQSRVAALAAGA